MANTTTIQLNTSSTSVVPKDIVEAKLTVTQNQMDVIAILLAEMSKETDDDENLQYVLTAKHFAELKEYANEKLAHTVLKEKICGSVKDHSQGMRHVGFDMKLSDDHYMQYNWFSQIEYNNGVITFYLTPQIKKLLVELKHNDNFKVFAKLKYILPLRSQYSKRIYLMCREFINTGYRLCDTNWEEFLEKLDIPTTYSLAKIKDRILDKAVEDINELSDIHISYKIQFKKSLGRTGTVPTGIKFRVDKKDGDLLCSK